MSTNGVVGGVGISRWKGAQAAMSDNSAATTIPRANAPIDEMGLRGSMDGQSSPAVPATETPASQPARGSSGLHSLRPGAAMPGQNRGVAMHRLTQAQLDELREDFSYNDANHDGRIQFGEFLALLGGLEAGMSDEEARIGFAEIDTDGDGSVAFDEFVAWWTHI